MSNSQFPVTTDADVAADASLEQSAENPAGTIGRQTSLYRHVDGLAPMPTEAELASTELDIHNIQADILVGMHKHEQLFYFFTIHDAAKFKRHLASDIAPVVSSVSQLSHASKQPLVALNIAFSHVGLLALGATDQLVETKDEDPAHPDPFPGGQKADAKANFNEDMTQWIPEFSGETVDGVVTSVIHGVILLASDSTKLMDRQVSWIERAFGPSMSKVYSLAGAIRPGDEAGHEMFGFLDGIAQPAIKQLHTTPLPGQNVIDAGIIITGATGDPIPRPAWAVGGSFLAFRQLEQLVPEFNQYLLHNAPEGEGSPQARADLRGARMVGRWKSGAPVDLAPTADDPALGADPQRNNNFTYEHEGFDLSSDQSHCPFSAHIRKTRPRADFKAIGADEKVNSIMRSGIPYGREVTLEEAASGKTTHPRGLAFVAYQAQLKLGFQFLQQSWADNASFPPRKNVTPGFDPIIGQAPAGVDRDVAGLNPNNTSEAPKIPQFVVSRGGEYFFSPPISALKGPLGTLDDEHAHQGEPPRRGEPPLRPRGAPPHGGLPHLGGPPHGGHPHFGGPPLGGPPQFGGAPQHSEHPHGGPPQHGGPSHHDGGHMNPFNHGH